jgi:hypothetical protein
MVYTCKGIGCSKFVETSDFDLIVKREKLCEECFANKYDKEEQAITVVNRHGLRSTFRRRKAGTGLFYTYMCYSCGWVSKPSKGRPLTCKTCKTIPLYQIDVSDSNTPNA